MIKMDYDIFKKEEEYRRENEVLEKKNKELMQKVENALKIQHSFNDGVQIKPPKLLEDDQTFPKSVEEMGIKGITHFCRAKVRAMQEDNEKLQAMLKKKCEELKKAEKESNTNQEEKEKWFLQFTASKNTICKMEKQIQTLNGKLLTKDNDVCCAKKNIEVLKDDIKHLTTKLNATEMRLNRSLEEIEKLKTSLKNMRQEEKDLKESHRNDLTQLTANLKQIEKQKTDLLNVFKKQIQLIDNLKRQKAHLECLKVNEHIETEFLKILEWRLE